MIQEFKDSFLHRHERCREIKAEGKHIMGCFYGLVPKEIVHAAGFLPIQLVEERDPRLEQRAQLLPFLCGMGKNLSGQIYDGHYSYLDGIIFATVCDTNRHLLDIWAYKKAVPYLRLLKTPSTATEAAVEFYANDLRRLARELARISGQEVTEERLLESIELFNENRSLMARFQDQREGLGVSAADALLVFASSLVTPVEKHNGMLRQLLERPSTPKSRDPSRPRVLLSALNLNMALDMIRLVEDYGGEVVADDFSHNARYGSALVPTQGDPFLALARGYLRRVPAPGIYSFEERATYLRDLMRRSGAQGLIYLVQLYCDAYAMEYAILRERLEAWGIRHLKLEAEDNPASLYQLNVRIQSFLESLG